jgi:hypothetical protein
VTHLQFVKILPYILLVAITALNYGFQYFEGHEVVSSSLIFPGKDSMYIKFRGEPNLATSEEIAIENYLNSKRKLSKSLAYRVSQKDLCYAKKQFGLNTISMESWVLQYSLKDKTISKKKLKETKC